ncbi:type II toxin-antitoxin system HipA family toxin [Methylobacterium sp. JK268]
MARRRAHRPLSVLANGRRVGTLRREATGAVDFRYAPEWLALDGTFPVSLSLPLREERYVGAPVLAVFDNLLPDSDPIRRRVAERVGAEGTDVYSLLSALGHDCVGALQFLPEGAEPGPVGGTDGVPLTEDDLARLVENLAVAPLGVGPNEDFRISIAGAQEKTALLRRDGRWFKPVGTTATTHILKPQIGRLPNGVDLSHSVENEYLCLRLVEALGVPAARAEIAEIGARRTLVVERFDRLWTQDGRLLRLPQEDCCQALGVPPSRKYQSDGGPGLREIVGLLKGSDRPEDDVAAVLRAAVVFWLIGATDGHAKNFSVFITPGGRFRLTPLYDVLTAQPSLDAGQIQRKAFRLAMSVGTNRHYAVNDVVPRHFLQSADLAGIGASVLRGISDDLAAHAVERTETVLAALPPGFPPSLAESVLSAIRTRVRLLDA